MFKKLFWSKAQKVLWVSGFIALSIWQLQERRPTIVHYLDSGGKEHAISMSRRDRIVLTNFFQMLFADDSFAYVLLGPKPMAWASYKNSINDFFNRRNRLMRRGWKTWQKYCFLDTKNLFFSEASTRHPGYVSILLINEQALNRVVAENRADFEKVLNRHVESGTQLLSKAAPFIDGILGGHQALLGITLGYGRENSWEFHRKSLERKSVEWVWTPEEYSKGNEEILDDSRTEYSIMHYSCPSFAGLQNSAESKALKRDYLKTKQRVLEYYKEKDFLEATLSLLAGYYPAKE